MNPNQCRKKSRTWNGVKRLKGLLNFWMAEKDSMFKAQFRNLPIGLQSLNKHLSALPKNLTIRSRAAAEFLD